MGIDALYVKRWLRNGASRLGLHVASFDQHRPVDARGEVDHPMALACRHPGRDLLLVAPSAWGFGLFNYPVDGPRPLQTVMKEAYRRPDMARVLIRETLASYYAAWQPANAAAFFGLTDDEAGPLARLPTWGAAWPWESLAVQAKLEQRRRTEGRESAAKGQCLDVEVDGWKFCGPVSERKLDVEVERLAGLLESIRARGVCRHDGCDGDIRAIVLVHDDGRWCWQVVAGQHRYAVLSALGHAGVTIRVERFVHRAQAVYWPWVMTGHFSPTAALKVFDGCFAMSPCPPAEERPGRFSPVSGTP